MGQFFIGVDLGQAKDYTAIAIIERVARKGDFDHVYRVHEMHWDLQLRYLERVPLGVPYPDIAARVVRITEAKPILGICHVAVDATGVGRPVVDMLRRANPKGLLQPVWVSSGHMETKEDGFYRVPKRDLIIGLQLMFQEKRVKIARNIELGKVLLEELQGMEVRVSAAGNEQYAAWREGQHDD